MKIFSCEFHLVAKLVSNNSLITKIIETRLKIYTHEMYL